MRASMRTTVFLIHVVLFAGYTALGAALGEKFCKDIICNALRPKNLEYAPSCLSFSPNREYAVYRHYYSPKSSWNSEEKKAKESIATVLFIGNDIKETQQEQLRRFCRESARDLIQKKYLEEIRTVLEAKIADLLDECENITDKKSIAKYADNINGFVSEYLGETFNLFDLGIFCQALQDIQPLEYDKPVGPTGKDGSHLFLAQYVFTFTGFEKDLPPLMQALRSTCGDQIARLANLKHWKEGQLNELRGNTAIWYLLNNANLAWDSFHNSSCAPAAFADKEKWGAFLDFLFKE